MDPVGGPSRKRFNEAPLETFGDTYSENNYVLTAGSIETLGGGRATSGNALLRRF